MLAVGKTEREHVSYHSEGLSGYAHVGDIASWRQRVEQTGSGTPIAVCRSDGVFGRYTITNFMVLLLLVSPARIFGILGRSKTQPSNDRNVRGRLMRV